MREPVSSCERLLSLVTGGNKRLNDIEKEEGVKPLFNVGEETVSIIK